MWASEVKGTSPKGVSRDNHQPFMLLSPLGLSTHISCMITKELNMPKAMMDVYHRHLRIRFRPDQVQWDMLNASQDRLKILISP